jgi:hypothetical protein
MAGGAVSNHATIEQRLRAERDAARAEVESLRTIFEGMRKRAVDAEALARHSYEVEERASSERAKLRDERDAALALLREIRNTAGMGFNGGIYERMAVADAQAMARIDALLEKAK